MSFITELQESSIVGLLLFFLGLIILYFFIKYFVRLYIHFLNRRLL